MEIGTNFLAGITVSFLLSCSAVPVDGTYPSNAIVQFGGLDKTSVSILWSSNAVWNAVWADVPFEPIDGIALLHSNGSPMVCGGSKNPNPKSCHIYHAANNSWMEGPSLLSKRVGASATCLNSGVCWVFGGKCQSFTEYYDPATGQFETGPAMPFRSAYGLCTALAPSGLIYMFARSKPEETSAFTFDPVTETFTEIASLDVEKRHAACGVLSGAAGSEDFLVFGGGSGNVTSGTKTTHIYNSASGVWTAGPDYPLEVMGPAAAVIDTFETINLFAMSGMTPSGVETSLVYEYNPSGWSFVADFPRHLRSFAATLAFDGICPYA